MSACFAAASFFSGAAPEAAARNPVNSIAAPSIIIFEKVMVFRVVFIVFSPLITCTLSSASSTAATATATTAHSAVAAATAAHSATAHATTTSVAAGSCVVSTTAAKSSAARTGTWPR